MTTRQMEYIIAIADAGSFSKAAKLLFTSQSSLSQYVLKLEAELGTQLFDRTSSLRLTAAGELYVNYARESLRKETQIRKMIQNITCSSGGQITIASSSFSCNSIISVMMKDFSKRFPDVIVNVQERSTPSLPALLHDGSCDFAVTNSPISDPEIVSELIGHEHFLLAVPRGISERLGLPRSDGSGDFPSIDFQLLAQEYFAILPRNKLGYLYFHEICEKNGIIVKNRCVCDSAIVCLHMMSMGICVTYLPESILLIRNQPDSTDYYRVNGDENLRTVYIARRSDLYCTEAIKTMFVILNRLAEHPFSHE